MHDLHLKFEHKGHNSITELAYQSASLLKKTRKILESQRDLLQSINILTLPNAFLMDDVTYNSI